LLWAAFFIFFFGKGKLLGAGSAIVPALQKVQDSPDELKRQCRYIAVRLLLPLAIIFTVLTIGEILEAAWAVFIFENPWIGIIFFLLLFIYIFRIVSKLNTGKYRKEE